MLNTPVAVDRAATVNAKVVSSIASTLMIGSKPAGRRQIRDDGYPAADYQCPARPTRHSGALVITGTVDHLEVRRSAEPSSNSVTGTHVGAVGNGNAHGNVHVGAPAKLDAAIVRTQAKEALVGLGWKSATANAAVAAASAALGTEATLERLIFEALRRCSRSGW